MIMTTDERLASIEAALKKLAGENEVQEKSFDESIDEKLSTLLVRFGDIEKKGFTSMATSEMTDIEPTTEEDKAFRKAMFSKLGWALLITSMATYISYLFLPHILFITMGVLFGIGAIYAGVWIDDVALQGNTFKRIAKSGIGSAILIACFIWTIRAGIEISSQLITDPLSNDTGRTTGEVRAVEDKKAEVKEEEKPDSTAATED